MTVDVFRRFCIFSILLTIGNCYNYMELQVKQQVDHFSYSNNDTFLQRYLLNADFYSLENGSIFFYTGNEGDIEMFANNTGFMWEHAKAFKAAIVFAEHRYYGKSLPYGKDSYKTNSYLGYLTTEQALADFAALISYLKEEKLPGGKHSPVIAFGGSYGGMLSAWLRMKYPHLVDGAISSSAPVLQFENMTACGKFAEIVTDDFTNSGISCSKSIRRSWEIIRQYGSTEVGRSILSKQFRLCKPLNATSVDSFVEWLSSTWSFLAMTDYPYATSFLQPLPAFPINVACKFLQEPMVPKLELLANIFKAVSVFQNYTGNIECFELQNSGGSTLGEKGWDYQACTEMVMPMCQTGASDMFEPLKWNFTSYSDECFRKWSVKPNLHKAVLMYGGKDIKASSNIVFTCPPLPYLYSNGLLDPWYGGGVLENLTDTLIAIVIPNAPHHLDLRASNSADPQSVKDARAKMLNWIKKWIYG